ncbi:HNH endonuclease [Paenibacillus sp. CAA11]|uniref:HNH endonuclease n=1 Tax=Paenibacillus sp. CAA11 TaxID=1532905 RepID=UPI001F2FDD25|nr:HNH endonuclease [Paenibacillus sp. CAA11]
MSLLAVPECIMKDTEPMTTKICAACQCDKPLSAFPRRSGKRAGAAARRGTCRECRKKRSLQAASVQGAGGDTPKLVSAVSESRRKPRGGSRSSASQTSKRQRATVLTAAGTQQQAGPRALHPGDASALKPLRSGFIRMRGRTDKGRRWQQEIELELAVTLVEEHAAVVVNPHTIRRLFTNKDFRLFILQRDHYTCRYCGGYGDTIDHLLPRAKGGHTTPDNCVCACHLCNQAKADRDVEEFIREDGEGERTDQGRE